MRVVSLWKEQVLLSCTSESTTLEPKGAACIRTVLWERRRNRVATNTLQIAAVLVAQALERQGGIAITRVSARPKRL